METQNGTQAAPEQSPPTLYPDKYTVSDASRFLIRRIPGWMSGYERRTIARDSADPAMRRAAAILDANDQRIKEEQRGER